VWAKNATRPTVIKQTAYVGLYLYAAVEPSTGHSLALHAADVCTETMDEFLRMLSDGLVKQDPAILITDQAIWHRSKHDGKVL